MAFVPKNNKWLGYTLYVVFVTLLLLYYLFPDQAVVNLVDNGISRINVYLRKIIYCRSSVITMNVGCFLISTNHWSITSTSWGEFFRTAQAICCGTLSTVPASRLG